MIDGPQAIGGSAGDWRNSPRRPEVLQEWIPYPGDDDGDEEAGDIKSAALWCRGVESTLGHYMTGKKEDRDDDLPEFREYHQNLRSLAFEAQEAIAKLRMASLEKSTMEEQERMADH